MESTDAQYNALSRNIQAILEIYFTDDDPIYVYTDTYLIDCDLLEESGADSQSPLGSISSNELSFTLLNEDGIFSPTNPDSPYAGLIKNGVKIKAYMLPNWDTDWDELGTFYVTSWKATVTGMTATVTANDIMQVAFSKPEVALPVVRDVTFKDLFTNIFSALNLPARVSPELTQKLLWSFTTTNVKTCLQEVTTGALATCYSGRDGVIEVDSLVRDRPLRAVLTDADQIIEAKIEQSIVKNYNGVELTYNVPQWTELMELLAVSDFEVPLGEYTHDPLTFSKNPVVSIVAIKFDADAKVVLDDYTATPYSIKLHFMNSSGSKILTQISIYGMGIDFIPTILTDLATNLFKLSSLYIQDNAYALSYKDVLNGFVNSQIPTLKVTIRGNPRLHINDKIQLISTKYNLDYTGIIQRAEYRYDGSLSCDLTLLDASIFTEVLT